MTATDELRRLLDERGVEWQDFDGEPTWMGSDGEMHYARQEFTFDGLTDNVTVYHLTPEQAVEATLGSDLKTENEKLREELDMYRDLVGMMDHPDLNVQLQAENAELREQTELLITLLRNDCDIEASWDGLRKFWSIGLTESGCLMRDRACKAEAENAKLRTFLGGGSIVTDYWKDEDGTMHVLTTDGEHIYEYMRGGLADENAMLREELDFCLKQVPNCDECEAMLDCWECLRANSSQKERKRLDYENGQLRELVRDMWNGMCGYEHDCRSCEHYELYEGQRLVGECQYHARMRELGVEV